MPAFIGGECECENGCNYANKGPWLDHPGDEIAESHKGEMEEIAKFEKDPENYVEPENNNGGQEEEEEKEVPGEKEVEEL